MANRMHCLSLSGFSIELLASFVIFTIVGVTIMNGLRLFSVRFQFIARFRFALPADFRSYFLSLIYFLVFYSIHAMQPFLYSHFGLNFK